MGIWAYPAAALTTSRRAHLHRLLLDSRLERSTEPLRSGAGVPTGELWATRSGHNDRSGIKPPARGGRELAR
jgi:hypothetical protein